MEDPWSTFTKIARPYLYSQLPTPPVLKRQQLNPQSLEQLMSLRSVYLNLSHKQEQLFQARSPLQDRIVLFKYFYGRQFQPIVTSLRAPIFFITGSLTVLLTAFLKKTSFNSLFTQRNLLWAGPVFFLFGRLGAIKLTPTDASLHPYDFTTRQAKVLDNYGIDTSPLRVKEISDAQLLKYVEAAMPSN